MVQRISNMRNTHRLGDEIQREMDKGWRVVTMVPSETEQGDVTYFYVVFEKN